MDADNNDATTQPLHREHVVLLDPVTSENLLTNTDRNLFGSAAFTGNYSHPSESSDDIAILLLTPNAFSANFGSARPPLYPMDSASESSSA